MILQDVYFHTQQLQNNDVKYSWIHSRTRRRYPSFLVDMPWWSHSDHTAVTHTTNLSAAAERIGRSFWISYRTATENVLCQLTGFRQWHCVFLSFPMAWMWTWLPRNPNIYPTGINLDGKLISFIVLFGELILFFLLLFFKNSYYSTIMVPK